MATTTIQIDSEFQALIPALTAEERQQLEANLRTNGGSRDPLVVWQGVLLDGHNRYEICEAHGLPYQVVEQSCADRNAAKVWIIRNQLGRRNLQPFQRGKLALLLEPLLAEEARVRMLAGVKDPHVNSREGWTNTILGKEAGLGDQTMSRIRALDQHASDEVKTKLLQGKMSVNRAFKALGRTRSASAGIKRKAEGRQPFAEGIRAEVRGRIEQVRDEALTLEQLAKRWGVHMDIARRYLREAALFGEVAKDGDRYTVTVTTEMARYEAFMETLDTEIVERRKAADGGYNKWRHDKAWSLNQSKVLDWIQDAVWTFRGKKGG